jgi:hypothetical protein
VLHVLFLPDVHCSCRTQCLLELHDSNRPEWAADYKDTLMGDPIIIWPY